MTTSPITILFFGDTHLGFDLPVHPRIQVRRRGDDFFSNYRHILNIAIEKKVDLILHGGDLFHRSRVPDSIVEKAYDPLIKVAKAGIPIYLVPGNHERSRLPSHLWLSHELIHVFDQPKTFLQNIGGTTIALTGFPFARKVNPNFKNLIQQTRHLEVPADLRFLCLHQAFDGATVGPSNFTFREDADTLSRSQIPVGFAAVLSGHIHRSQYLKHSPGQPPFNVPVIYPGSIERTSFAERFEDKHFVLLRITPTIPFPKVEFHRLPSRPMHKVQISIQNLSSVTIRKNIRAALAELDPDSIVRIQLTNTNGKGTYAGLSSSELRDLAPSSMNVSLDYPWNKSIPKSKPLTTGVPG